MSKHTTIEKYSLLPNNRSLLERGMELAFYRLLYDIENPYPQLLNPKQSQPALLPYLAQDRGVNAWDANASEQEQRHNVANAWLVRRYAGTKKGIALALDSLGYDSEIQSWYETQKEQPYHFSVLAWRRNNSLISAEVIADMHYLIEQGKSERDSYELAMALGGEASLGLSLIPDQQLQIEDVSVTSVDFTAQPLGGQLSVAGGLWQLQLDDLSVTSVDFTALPQGGQLLLASGLRQLIITDFTQ